MAAISRDAPYKFCYLYYLLFNNHWKGCKFTSSKEISFLYAFRDGTNNILYDHIL